MATPRNNKFVINLKKNFINMSNGCPIIVNSSFRITESVSDYPIQQISRPTTVEEFPSWDLTVYKNRLRTFNGVWKLQFLTPNQMARAGLYYIGPQDRVRCTFCSIELDYWQHDNDPFVEHKRQSPHCAFFNEDIGVYDVCGIYGFDPADDHELRKCQDYLVSVGILHKIKPPEYNDFATLEARLQSFEKCLIPLKQNIQTLCESGLFYTGTGTNDHMYCYYCSQGLKEWEDNDEPWAEHAKWSPTCNHVLLNKGKNFVDEACGVISTKFNEMEFLKSIAEHKDTSMAENNMIVNSTKKNLDKSDDTSQIKIISVENQQICQKQDPNTMPDSMLCKICYKEEMKVAFVPCGHVVACINCALTLEQCAICRQPLNMVMRVHLLMEEEKVKDLEQLPCSSSQCLDGQLDPMLCKVCHKEELAAAFIPCRHVYACAKCVVDIDECPICTESYCGTIQVYL